MAVDGNTFVVGDPLANSGHGAAFVYTKVNGGWVPRGDGLTAADGIAGDDFGRSLDISGDYLIVGAPGVDDGRGAAYAFERLADGSWRQFDKPLTVAERNPGDALGFSVALDGTRAVIGAYRRDLNVLPPDDNEGEAYAFELKDGEWKPRRALTGNDAQAGDMVGYAVDIYGDTALVGAPQFDGRPTIDTQGAGYAFLRSVSPPVNVIVPERQEELIAGAQANVLSGTLGGVQTARLSFFDIASVSLQTGSGSDQLTIGEAGLTAYGLSNFQISLRGGDDTLTTYSTRLNPPAAGAFRPVGDFGTAQDGDPIPDGAGYIELPGGLSFDGGLGNDSLVAVADGDWKLQNELLLANSTDHVGLAAVEVASLTGGETGNQVEVESWNGVVTLDGAGGSDQITVHLTNVANATVIDAGGPGDHVTILGSDQSEEFTVLADSILTGTNVVDYSGAEVVRITGQAGDDTFNVLDSTAGTLFLDGSEGSDDYQIVDPGDVAAADVQISDSGPPPFVNGDIDTLLAPASSLPTVNQPFNVGEKTVLYDETIEETDVTGLTPYLSLTGTINPDLIILDGPTLQINQSYFNISSVLELKNRFAQWRRHLHRPRCAALAAVGRIRRQHR